MIGRQKTFPSFFIYSVACRRCEDLPDWLMNLVAKQTTPVIEVGAAKKVTVIISEGKELEIKDFVGELL